ncbi:hypothetical protein ACH4ZX_18915 [Streptomyces sp. NPDC020490]|uniref:hypothetical protein n=1 Tax=Streptomyces sp. NPDC020490 TaxID=3365078 RepID=UPI00378FE960
MDITPELPITPLLRQRLPQGDLPAAQAHQVMLYCALDAACVPPLLRDDDAIATIAELDYPAVRAVIDWVKSAGTRSY